MKDCVKLFMSEKKKLRAMFVTTSAQVCLTTDTWTLVQKINYMVITSHFINSDWNLHKRILNFCLIPNHKGETIEEKMSVCLSGVFVTFSPSQLTMLLPMMLLWNM
jgi:hypothetical protein